MKFIEYANRKSKPNNRVKIQAEPPINLERQFQRELFYILEPAIAEINKLVLKKLPVWLDYYSMNTDGFFDQNESDENNTEVSSWFDKIKLMLGLYLTYKGIKSIIKKYSDKIVKYSKVKLDNQIIKKYKMNPYYSEDNIEKSKLLWIDRNINSVNDIANNYVNKIQAHVNNVITKSRASENKTDHINEFKATVDVHAQKIEGNIANLARDQVSGFDGETTMILQNEIGVKKFIWQTCRDERVRPTHRELEGRECDWNDLPKIAGETVWPGSQYNCRCTAKPIF
ncbi:minor capsid protein [Fluviispira vulneris]|uniref:minor capsid protein n=1 Tax=Fluviispira vulneris TaxID=2763012 RepID=UPI001644BEB7|nr:minor capsid protein [Fluviispira vulneris]